MNEIGKNIREIRKSKNITMKQLANEIGTTEANISRYEKGIIKDIPLKNLEKIARFLNVTLNELLGLKNHNTLLSPYNEFIDFIEDYEIKLNENDKMDLLELIDKHLKTPYDFNIAKEYCKNIGIKFPFTLDSPYIDILFFSIFFNIIDYVEYFKKNYKDNFDNFDNDFPDNLFGERNKINNINLSQNKKIQDLQKEIIDITTKIDNVEIVEDIRDIAQLKLDKTKNSPK
ncbi:helix-turn-helix transcriptional regulator [Streptobacillus felis]|uniref:helix-turn-helix domain-containing protein n=1 Tax=Streptobacillus felis TaxID=1384509 RepID=UPI00082E76E4|nr:helix-turn-helix transcriptional regulator [Streptobacillus felis]